MRKHISTTPPTGAWRYWLALWLVIAAGGLGLAGYFAKPTAGLSSSHGLTQLRQAVWLFMGTLACLCIAGILAVHEATRRHAARVEARSPIPYREYIDLLQTMLNRARHSSSQPVTTTDIERLLTLVQPAIAFDDPSTAKGE